MPLDPKHEVRVGILLILSSLDCLDHTILRAARDHPEPVSGYSDSLMMAGVDWKPAESILNGSLTRCQKAADDGVGNYNRRMGDGNVATSGVVYRDWIQVLNQGSPTPDVQGLRSEADGEQGLIEVVSVLDEKLIDVFTSRIGRVALGNGLMPELLRVYVCR
jgi:hypothetical protein